MNLVDFKFYPNILYQCSNAYDTNSRIFLLFYKVCTNSKTISISRSDSLHGKINLFSSSFSHLPTSLIIAVSVLSFFLSAILQERKELHALTLYTTTPRAGCFITSPFIAIRQQESSHIKTPLVLCHDSLFI